MAASSTSSSARKQISTHIAKHRKAGMPQDQAVAAAMNEARRSGKKVAAPKTRAKSSSKAKAPRKTTKKTSTARKASKTTHRASAKKSR